MVPDRRSARALRVRGGIAILRRPGKGVERQTESIEGWYNRRAQRHAQPLEPKHAVQALAQAKIAEYNKKIFQSLREDGENAAQKFWQYVQTLDRRQQNSPQLRDADTNQPVAHVGQRRHHISLDRLAQREMTATGMLPRPRHCTLPSAKGKRKLNSAGR